MHHGNRLHGKISNNGVYVCVHVCVCVFVCVCKREKKNKFKDMHSLRSLAFYYFLRELILKMVMTGLRVQFNNALLTISQTLREGALGALFIP